MRKDPLFVRKGKLTENVEHVLYIRLDDGELLGVMIFGTQEKKGFTEDDILIAQAISHLATASIRHHRMLIKNEHLKTRISERSSLAHQIRNPLMTAGGFTRRIHQHEKSKAGAADPKILNYSEIAVQEYKRVEELLSELLKT
jgi:signal transduction histidine kinase